MQKLSPCPCGNTTLILARGLTCDELTGELKSPGFVSSHAAVHMELDLVLCRKCGRASWFVRDFGRLLDGDFNVEEVETAPDAPASPDRKEPYR